MVGYGVNIRSITPSIKIKLDDTDIASPTSFLPHTPFVLLNIFSAPPLDVAVDACLSRNCCLTNAVLRPIIRKRRYSLFALKVLKVGEEVVFVWKWDEFTNFPSLSSVLVCFCRFRLFASCSCSSHSCSCQFPF